MHILNGHIKYGVITHNSTRFIYFLVTSSMIVAHSGYSMNEPRNDATANPTLINLV